MAADLIFGGPSKVMLQWITVVLAGLVQGAFVLVPVLLPLLFIALRSTRDNPHVHSSRYVVETGMTELSTLQTIFFIMGTTLVLCGESLHKQVIVS
jgi:uncharacterized membrane protein YciS (DUF1049 family)